MNKHDPNNHPQFLRVKPEEVTLKFIFDHIRNIILSALVCSVGIIIIKEDAISILPLIPYTQTILGIMVFFGGLLLVTLNTIQGAIAILVTQKVNITVYVILAVLLQIISFEIFFKQVSKLINN